MATKYEGIVIELGADVSKLQAAMRNVNSATSKTQKELRQIQTALKFNPGNLTLLKQQTEQWSNTVNETKDRLRILRAQLDQLGQDQNNIGTDEWDKLQREIIQTESKLESYEATLREVQATQKTYDSSLGQLAASIQKNSAAFAKVGNAMKSAGTSATVGLTVPLVAAGAQATAVAANFDDAMSQVSGALGGAGVDMEGLRTLALQLGADTVFSATEAGSAMVELAKGGLTEADIKAGALQASMDLAAAGSMELADAANSTVQAMGAFQLGAEDAGLIANALAGAANASSADVSDLTQALSQCSAQANLVGWSIQDTSAALAMFSDAGVTGSDAGTSLKTMLQRLAAPVDKAAAQMQELGLEVRNADGSMKGVAEIAQELQTKLGGLSEAQRDAALQTIFGSDASRAAAIMMTNGAAGLQKYTDATHSLTAAEEMAAAQKGELSWALENMNGAIESASIALGTALAPAIQAVAGVVGDLATWFTSLPAPMQSVIAVVLALVAALGPVLTVLGMIIAAIPALNAGMIALSTAVAIPLAPIAAIAAAIGAVVAVLVYLWNTNEGFRVAVIEAWNNIQAAIQSIMEALQPFIQNAWTFIQNVVLPAVQAIAEGVGNAFTVILNTVSNIMNAVSQVIQGVWNVIQGIFDTVCGFIVGIVTGDFSLMQQGVNNILTGLSQIISGIWNGITSTITGAVNAIRSIIEGVLNGAFQAVSGIFSNIANAIGDKIGQAKNFVSDGLNAIANFFGGLKLELPRIKLPHFSISGSFSLNPPSIPHIGVEWYAKGGIINKPSIIGVGEAGAEAVMPLAKLPELMAEALQIIGGGTGGGTVIVQEMNVRSENDIRSVAQELHKLGKRAARAKGTVYA